MRQLPLILMLLADHGAAACDGVAVKPGLEIQSVVEKHAAGTTYCIEPGLHRVARTIEPKNGDKFVGAPGAILTGARPIVEWTRKGAVWMAGGQTQRSELSWKPTWPALADPAAQFNEDVFLDGRQLKRVLALAEVTTGKFYFDYDAAAIYIADDPSGHQVEASVTQNAIQSRATSVTVQGLTIERFTIAGISVGRDALIQQNEVRYVHGAGIRFGSGARVLSNRTHHNGKYGMAGAGESPLVEGNEIAFNNTAGYHTVNGGCWDAGGTKFVLSTHLVVRNNHVHDNYCGGLWSDIDNIDTTYEGNRIENNYAQGLFIEISYAGVIRNNIIRDNMGPGILINSSSDQDIHDNEITENGAGTPPNGAAVHPALRGSIVIIQQNRGDGLHGPRLARNNYVHDNRIAMTAGVTGPTRAQGNAAVFTQNNRFAANHYEVPDLAGKWWVWQNGPCTWDEWRSHGQDAEGTVRGR